MSSWIFVVFAAVALAVLKVVQVFVEGQRNPLGHVPGPWHTKYTGLVWRVNATITRLHPWVHRLHRQYGPYVRVHPDIVAVADPSAVGDIFRTSRVYPKGPVYSNVPRGIFSERDPIAHGKRRRLFARPLSKSSLQTLWGHEVRSRAQLAVRSMKQMARRDGVVDIYKWWALMANDIITTLSFGESFDMVAKGEQHPLIEGIKHMIIGQMLNRKFPLFMSLVKLLPIERLQTVLYARQRVEQYTALAVENFRKSSGNKDATHNLFRQIVDQADDKDSPAVRAISDADLREEALTMVFAGSDTTSNTLTYLVWNIVRRPSLRQAVEDEVSGLSDELAYDDLERAPLLNAALQETLRLFGPVQVGLQRVVPTGGASFGRYQLPEGTLVWPQMYTTSRDPDIWENPLEFDPGRFMGRELTPDQKKVYLPFGGGTRTCIGMNLAWMEMLVGAATFFRECKGAEVADTTTPDMMELTYRFVSSPRGGHCWINM